MSETIETKLERRKIKALEEMNDGLRAVCFTILIAAGLISSAILLA